VRGRNIIILRGSQLESACEGDKKINLDGRYIFVGEKLQHKVLDAVSVAISQV